jgi:hypothetical protein
MKSNELADEAILVCMDANRRIMTTGDEQYSEGEDHQAFEDEDLVKQLDHLEEEMLDQINYCCMTVLKIRARRKALQA